MSTRVDTELSVGLIVASEPKARHRGRPKRAASRRTEHWRSKLSGWRETIRVAFGRDAADSMTEDIRLTTRLSIPHSGPLAVDSKGYLGDDPQCDSYVGKVS